MQRPWKFMVLGIAVVTPVAIAALALGAGPQPRASRVQIPDLVQLRPGTIKYRASGEYLRDRKPAMSPIVTFTIKRALAVMKHQVTEADYRRCVEAGACSGGEQEGAASDRPVVKVSWRDATAYASWLSHETGVHFRLPTDEEWAFAAGSRFTDDALPEGSYDGSPGRRILAIYERDVSRGAIDKVPQSIGSFGANEHGLHDIAGNVWEWTDTCFSRSTLDERGEIVSSAANCWARVVEGRHRSYLSDFIRDAVAGGCSVGAPPSNLGFRLVRDDDPWLAVRLLWRGLLVGF